MTIIAGGHQHGQGVELALVLALAAHDLLAGPGEEHRDQADEDEQQAEERGQAVDHHQVAHDGLRAPRVQRRPRRRHRR